MAALSGQMLSNLMGKFSNKKALQITARHFFVQLSFSKKMTKRKRRRFHLCFFVMGRPVQEVVRKETGKLSLQGTLEEEKIAKICDAVCGYYAFNKRYAGLSCGDYIESLLSKQGACQDYAQLFYMMCKEENIQWRLIFGESDRGYHAWCRAKAEGRWKYIDSTWSDAGGIYPPTEELWYDHWEPKTVSIRNMY